MAKNQEAVDEHRDTEALLSLLDATDRMPSLVRLRIRSYQLLSLVPGSTVVDVGCGAGRAVAELAERGVHAVGVDPDPWMLTAARKRWPGAEFREAGAEALPFADGSVRGYRADKVLHILPEPQRALTEARRVLAPGGRIVLTGQDWDAFMIEADDAALTRTIVHACADRLGSPRAARRYRNLLLDSGFEDVTVEMHALVFTDATVLPLLTRFADTACATGAINRTQADTWLADHHHRTATNRALLAAPIFLTAATAPA
jgi:ubiquinone/menaquinone biosynthesis C-methylase UbiE